MGCLPTVLFARVFRPQPKSDLTYNEVFTYTMYVYYNSNVKNQGIKTLPMPTAGPTPKSRREEYADATRQALIAAAGELFTSEGYQQVGIEAIARSARDGRLTLSDDRGRVLSEASSVGADAQLIGELPLRDTHTLYTQWGDWFGWLCVLGLALVLMRAIIRRG